MVLAVLMLLAVLGAAAGCPHNKFLHAIVSNANAQALLHVCHTAPPVVPNTLQHSASAHLLTELLRKRYCYSSRLLRMHTHILASLLLTHSELRIVSLSKRIFISAPTQWRQWTRHWRAKTWKDYKDNNYNKNNNNSNNK